MSSKNYQQHLLNIVPSTSIEGEELIQSLWGGYGRILRVQLRGGEWNSVIVKLIEPMNKGKHPRGCDTDYSHQRKLKSYGVEEEWYNNYNRISPEWRIPQLIGVSSDPSYKMIVLEDLNEAGFILRKHSVSLDEVKLCLSWLAHFHANHLNVSPKGLWEEGCYWHLGTRPDEFDAMGDGDLKRNAEKIDRKLRSNKYRTLVHGDAKLANFCFSNDGSVAGVDFQYVGGGCGIKDVAYFLSSCLGEEECARYELILLDHYFATLQGALEENDRDVFNDLKKEWMGLYQIAWADFARFLLGWMPEHQKLHGYTKRMVDRVLSQGSLSK